MTDKFRNIVIDFINEEYGNKPIKNFLLNNIHDDINLRNDWGFDSMDVTEFIMYLELRYCIDISEDEAVWADTLEEMSDICDGKSLIKYGKE
jgi:acyl carrier protein